MNGWFSCCVRCVSSCRCSCSCSVIGSGLLMLNIVLCVGGCCRVCFCLVGLVLGLVFSCCGSVLSWLSWLFSCVKVWMFISCLLSCCWFWLMVVCSGVCGVCFVLMFRVILWVMLVLCDLNRGWWFWFWY